MNTTPKKNDTILRHVESIGGVKIALTTLILFVGYVILASNYPNFFIVKALQQHGSTGQVVALFGVIALALGYLGVRKMLFRTKESRQIEELSQIVSALQEADVQKTEQIKMLQELVIALTTNSNNQPNTETPPKKQ